MFLNSDIDQLYLTKLGDLFQIKDPQKCADLVAGIKSPGPRLSLYGTSL